jgi:hypothetical protein
LWESPLSCHSALGESLLPLDTFEVELRRVFKRTCFNTRHHTPSVACPFEGLCCGVRPPDSRGLDLQMSKFPPVCSQVTPYLPMASKGWAHALRLEDNQPGIG